MFSSNAAEAIILGFQHYIVMLGTTVLIASILVPLMGGGNVSTFWFCDLVSPYFGLFTNCFF